MFEISWSELLILAVVTLLFVGPKELPVFLRTIGRYAGMLRRQASEFRGHFDAAMREAELSSMKEEMDKMQASVNAEVMGAEQAFKDAGQAANLAPNTQAAQAASFTAAAAAAVFPQSAAMGQVYTAPKSEPEPADAAPPAPAEPHAIASAPAQSADAKEPRPHEVAPEAKVIETALAPPLPQVVRSES